jgi:hypothetical protein
LHCTKLSIPFKNGKYSKGMLKMRKSTRSILQELSDLGVNRNKDLVIESRGTNLIESAINLLSLIRENYDLETSAELERRFINAIRTAEPAKFKRGIKKIQESKDDTA